MKKIMVVVLMFCGAISSSAVEYASINKINLGEGNYADLQIRLNQDGTYLALVSGINGFFDANGGQGY